MGKDLKGKELGKGINQLKDGRYRGRYLDEFGKRCPIYDTNLRLLKDKLEDTKIEVLDRKKRDLATYTIDEWYNTWIAVFKRNKINDMTRKSYMEVYENRIQNELGAKILQSVTLLQMQKYFNKLSDDGFARNYIKNIKMILVDMFNYAVKSELIEKNIVEEVSLPEKGNEKPRVLTVKEQIAFFSCVKGYLHENLFLLAVSSGLRVAELVALTEDDIDFEKGVIHVTRTLQKTRLKRGEDRIFRWWQTKTKSSVRDVPLNETSREALQNQIRLKRKMNLLYPQFNLPNGMDKVLFVTRKNLPIDTAIINTYIITSLKKVNNDASQPVTIEHFSMHSFRHTFATRCLEAGISIKIIQSYLGHSSIETTMNLYAHVLEEHSQSEMQKLDILNEKISTA